MELENIRQLTRENWSRIFCLGHVGTWRFRNFPAFMSGDIKLHNCTTPIGPDEISI